MALRGLREGMDFFETWSDDAGVRLCFETAPGGPYRPSADHGMPLSALAKPIGNALRHAARGEIAISRTFENPRSVRIEVENRGAAIAPEHLAHRFDRLLRIDPKHHRAGQGAGLSLAIDETFALAHGESFGVSSSVGRNRFWRRIASA
ncbi:MAG: hypothetical protein KDF63_11375 [Rhodoferax sp.]|nr:hypothetical protein [Rhodoferax sp.]MCP5290854.1 hypothetical protein [Burkholderiaceae bacterium]